MKWTCTKTHVQQGPKVKRLFSKNGYLYSIWFLLLSLKHYLKKNIYKKNKSFQCGRLNPTVYTVKIMVLCFRSPPCRTSLQVAGSIWERPSAGACWKRIFCTLYSFAHSQSGSLLWWGEDEKEKRKGMIMMIMMRMKSWKASSVCTCMLICKARGNILIVLNKWRFNYESIMQQITVTFMLHLERVKKQNTSSLPSDKKSCAAAKLLSIWDQNTIPNPFGTLCFTEKIT